MPVELMAWQLMGGAACAGATAVEADKIGRTTASQALEPDRMRLGIELKSDRPIGADKRGNFHRLNEKTLLACILRTGVDANTLLVNRERLIDLSARAPSQSLILWPL